MPEYWESVSEIARTPLQRPQQPVVRGTASPLFEGPHQPIQVALASFRRRSPVHGVDGAIRAPLTSVFCKWQNELCQIILGQCTRRIYRELPPIKLVVGAFFELLYRLQTAATATLLHIFDGRARSVCNYRTWADGRTELLRCRWEPNRRQRK